MWLHFYIVFLAYLVYQLYFYVKFGKLMQALSMFNKKCLNCLFGLFLERRR